jgi:hypothetical protein
MTYNLTFLENNTAQGVIIGLNQNIPSFLGLILLFEWFIIAMAGSYSSSRRTGYTNFVQWGALAGLVTTVSAFFLGGIFVSPTDYVSFLPTIIICLVVTVLFALATFFTPDNI